MFRFDALAAAPAVAFTLAVAMMIAAAPGGDARRKQTVSLLTVLAGTLLIFTAANALVLFVGWVMSAWPLIRTSNTGALHTRGSVALGASCVLLAGAAVLLGGAGFDAPAPLGASETAWAFGLASAAALIRNGIFPFHSWIVSAYDNSEDMLPVAALLSAQSGAFLVARLASVAPRQAQIVLPFASALALFSALVTAFLTLGETTPRRTLALVAASQSAFLISGLEIRNVEGITGALVHSLVVAVCIAGLATVYRVLYARCGSAVDERFAGVGTRVPRLSVFFLVFALALAGLPGTLGFAAEDLLFHGALEVHPALGIALPLATALTAISLLRVYAYIFLGKRNLYVAPLRDALLRERLACTALMVVLVACGLMPGAVIASRVGPATRIAEALGGSAQAALGPAHGQP